MAKYGVFAEQNMDRDEGDMDREQLQTLLPHRDDMLLLDALEIQPGYVRGTYRVQGDGMVFAWAFSKSAVGSRRDFV